MLLIKKCFAIAKKLSVLNFIVIVLDSIKLVKVVIVLVAITSKPLVNSVITLF